ncbi:MAG: tetratricopeptide repeat protein [Verrucomicrobiota bacterium]|nr:tetratricopeptide repeat protein [Verrucomicrobiota bacterium]
MQPAQISAPDPLLETQLFWTKYKMPILLAVLGALAVLAVVSGYRFYTARRDADAATALSTAKTPADYQKVISDYPSSAAAPSARLLLASAQRDARQFAEANTTLQAFADKYPKHELVSTAKMAMAANLESMGKIDEALEMYRRVAADYPRSYNAPLALLAEVPLLKHKDQKDEARKVCETVLTQYRDSVVSSVASNYMRTLKAAAPPIPPPAAVAPAPAAPAPAAAAATPAASP